MSLTSFLNENLEARKYLSTAFPKPSIRRDVPLLVPSDAPRPGEIGAAFDYIFRFYIQRLNPQTADGGQWVAEGAIPIVQRVDRNRAARAREVVHAAKQLLVAFLKGDAEMSDELLASAIRLARLDTIYRSGRGLEYFDSPITAAELHELRELYLHLNPDDWRTDGSCHLNPTFGVASHAIGGADADAIIGDLLVDLKSTKTLVLTIDDWLQIVGYRVLSILDQLVSGEIRTPTKALGIYFARYGYLARWEANVVATEVAWHDAVVWLASALDIRLVASPRLPARNEGASGRVGHRVTSASAGAARVLTMNARRGITMGSSARYELVPVDAIELDTTNPRIAHALSSYKPPYKAEQIYLALNAGGREEEGGTTTTFNKLKQSIFTNGGISQPVHLHEKAKGKYVSIEGNTRVAIYQEFKQQKAKGSWDKIPAFVYSDLHDEQLHAIRLQAHLVGPRPWDPYSKAKYLRHLRNDLSYPFDRLVDLCGGNKRSIQESLQAYEDMEGYYRPLLKPGEPFDTDRFSGFVELQKAGVKQALQQTGYSVKDFAQWIRSRKIERLADVRVLPRVLKDPKARQVFIDVDIDAAKKVLELPEVSETLQRAGLLALCRALTQTIQKVEFSELRKLKQDLSSPMVQDISETFDTLRGLIEDIGLKADEV